MHQQCGAPDAEQYTVLLRRLLASIASVDEVYTAWNARTPGWDGGPVFECDSQSIFPADSPAARWRATVDHTTYRIADVSLQRVYFPLRMEAGADSLRPHARPLAGLSAFRQAVESELRFLSKSSGNAPERVTNAGYMLNFWSEVLMCILTRGPVVALNTSMHYDASPGVYDRALSETPVAPIPTGSGAVRINIIALGGALWVRLIPTRKSALLAEFREADSVVSLDSLPGYDEVLECSIVRSAREMLFAAQGQSSSPPKTLEIVCTRLEAPKVPLYSVPRTTEPAYWTASEEQRFEWRLALITHTLRQLGLRVRFGTSDVPCISLPLPPAPVVLAPTLTLNLDVSALLGLASDVSHCGSSLDVCDSSSARPLTSQIAAETGTGLLEMLAAAYPGVRARDVGLVTTPECAAKFRAIVQAVGSPTECARAEALVPEIPHTQQTAYNMFWASTRLVPHANTVQRILALPVRILDCSALAQSTYSHDQGTCAFAASLSTALDVVLANPSTRPKALSNSVHTWQALCAGVRNKVTTLSAHAHGVRELLVASHIHEPAGMPRTAAIWLMRPRSLVGRMARSAADATGVSPLVSQEPFFKQHSLPLDVSRRPTFDTAAVMQSPAWSPVLHSAGTPLDESIDSSFHDMVVVDGTTALDGDAPINRKHSTWTRPFDSPIRQKSDPESFLDTVSEVTRLNIGTSLSPGPKRPRSWRSAVLDWISGPRPPARLEIRQSPWWPFGSVEKAWLRLTAHTGWNKPHTHDSLALHGHSVHDSRFMPWQAWFSSAAQDLWHNRMHWSLLFATCLLWFFLFVLFVHYNWFTGMVRDAQGWHVPKPLGCTDTFWLRNSGCGSNGIKCEPFDEYEMLFRCPSKCINTKLLNPRTVGNVQYTYMPLVVGGPTYTGHSVYRADSFICVAAQHAGVISDNGGCGKLRKTGAFAGFAASVRNGISSIPFSGVFPSSFSMSHVDQWACSDNRTGGYMLNVIFSVFITFVLRPRPDVLFWILAVVGFWHVNFVSELRDFPPPVGDAVGDFLPYLFGCYAIWRVTGQYLWHHFENLPLEFGVWTLGFWWIGVLMTVIFEDVPVQRLVLRDIMQQPGGLLSLFIILAIGCFIGANQVLVIRSAGYLPKYLFFYILGTFMLCLGAVVPGEGLRIHHYIVGLVFIPAFAFPTRMSLILFAFLFGMYINGVARWGFDGILQDLAVIQGDATGESPIPEFAVDARTWLSGSSRVVHWKSIPPHLRGIWDSFMLIVDDVLRYHGPGTSFDLAQLPDIVHGTTTHHKELVSTALLNRTITDGAHYLRLAYAKNGVPGDFTMTATAYFNGTWKNPPVGRT